MWRRSVFGSKKTTLTAGISGVLLAFNVFSPEQAQAVGGLAAVLVTLIIGQVLSKDGDKD